jgi:D-3-phosphoglycerate dehydrogenase
LIGFGRIAQNLTRKLAAFGFKMIAYDPFLSQSFMNTYGVKKVELDELFSTSDAVNVLAPYTDQTYHIVNDDTLKLMKREAFLVCVSRGKCVDNKALYRALKDGIIAGAALDDPEEEPMKIDNWSPQKNDLFKLPNCFFTPHTAYVSKQSLEECRHVASNNVKAVLLGEKPFDIVRPKK